MDNKRSATNFNEFDTPRQLPAFLKFRLKFLGALNIIGLLLMSSACLMPLLAGDGDDYAAAAKLDDNDPMVKGIITGMETTGSRVNRETIYKFEYTYAVAGTSYKGTSFGSKRNLLSQEIVIGDSMDIQYAEGDPSVSRIFGKSKQKFGLWVWLVMALFPAVGLLAFIKAVKTGGKNIAILTNGVLTKGKFLRKETTGGKVNKKPVYKLYFTFKDRGGNACEVTAETHRIERLMDEAEEYLVYDQNAPQQAVLLDSLPGAVKKYFSLA